MTELLDRIKSRKFFYRDYYRRACTLLWIALLIIFALSFIDVYLYIQKPEPAFYATSSDGKLVQLGPLDQPNYSKKPLIE